MNWFVGVDGGGTKTDFAISGADGVPAATVRRSGCSYQTIGIDAVAALISDGVGECLSAVNVGLGDCAGICLGIPCYGEDPEGDRKLRIALAAALSPAPIYLANDVEVGWAGSLECREGIHIVAGTGSIAFGRGRDKRTARCGGWTEFFGDEGSCYWIGREAMSLFSKEADGRAPRGALYELIRRELNLSEDFRFVDAVLRDWAPHREKTAQFQTYALWAAQVGDGAAIALYGAAARELFLMVKTLKGTLDLPSESVSVSYSGGLFQAGELILGPLREQVMALGCTLQEPRHSAVEGALMLGIEQFNGRI